jgi:hypothetical protein
VILETAEDHARCPHSQPVARHGGEAPSAGVASSDQLIIQGRWNKSPLRGLHASRRHLDVAADLIPYTRHPGPIARRNVPLDFFVDSNERGDSHRDRNACEGG